MMKLMLVTILVLGSSMARADVPGFHDISKVLEGVTADAPAPREEARESKKPSTSPGQEAILEAISSCNTRLPGAEASGVPAGLSTLLGK